MRQPLPLICPLFASFSGISEAVFISPSSPRDTPYAHASTVTAYSPTATVLTTVTTHPATLDKSCTFTGTQTFFSTRSCPWTCSTGFCITDAPVTKSCGCPSIKIETKTITICPTRTPCYQCTTGWGTFIIYPPCLTSVTQPPPLAAPTK